MQDHAQDAVRSDASRRAARRGVEEQAHVEGAEDKGPDRGEEEEAGIVFLRRGGVVVFAVEVRDEPCGDGKLQGILGPSFARKGNLKTVIPQ